MSHSKKQSPEKISSADPRARDEGPRLLPIEDGKKPPRSDSFDQRYLELADTAMHPKSRRSRHR